MSVVKVEGIFLEDIFKWFYEHVMDSCGDGCAAIVCEDFKDIYNKFLKWFQEKYNKDFLSSNPCHKIYENTNSIIVHDGNENFIFTNDKDIQIYKYDYIFLVNNDCKLAKEIYARNNT